MKRRSNKPLTDKYNIYTLDYSVFDLESRHGILSVFSFEEEDQIMLNSKIDFLILVVLDIRKN